MWVREVARSGREKHVHALTARKKGKTGKARKERAVDTRMDSTEAFLHTFSPPVRSSHCYPTNATMPGLQGLGRREMELVGFTRNDEHQVAGFATPRIWRSLEKANAQEGEPVLVR